MRILVICTLLSASFAAFAHESGPFSTATVLACSEIKSGPPGAAPKACLVQIEGRDGEQFLALDYPHGGAIFAFKHDAVIAADSSDSRIVTGINIGTVEKKGDFIPSNTKWPEPTTISVRLDYDGKQLKRLTVITEKSESVYENFVAE